VVSTPVCLGCGLPYAIVRAQAGEKPSPALVTADASGERWICRECTRRIVGRWAKIHRTVREELA